MPRNSVVKVLTPPNDDAVVTVAAPTGYEVEDASFDAFKAVPATERRLSQQNVQTNRGVNAVQPSPSNGMPNSYPLQAASPMRNGSGTLPMLNRPGYMSPGAFMGTQQPFLMQVPPPMTSSVKPTYTMMMTPQQQQQQQQMAARMRSNGNMSSNTGGQSASYAPRDATNGSTQRPSNGAPPPQRAGIPNGTSGAPTARPSQTMTRPHPTAQRQPVMLPENDAVFMPDSVEDPNVRFKQAKQQSMRRKRDKQNPKRNNSAPQLRSLNGAGEEEDSGLNKRHSDPLPEISQFDDTDFGFLSMPSARSSQPPRHNRKPSPPADALDYIVDSMKASKQANSLVREDSSGVVGESSLTNFDELRSPQDGAIDKRAPAKGANHEASNDSDAAPDLTASQSGNNYSYGSFIEGDSVPKKDATRSAALDVRAKKKPAGSQNRVLSPVPALDEIVRVDTAPTRRKDSFSERYFGFDVSSDYTSPKLATGNGRRLSQLSRSGRSTASASRVAGTGPTGQSIYGSPLGTKGSAAGGGSGFDWDAPPSAFGSGMFGSFANASDAANLYSSDSSSKYSSPKKRTVAEDSSYGITGLDSFLLRK